MTDPKAILPAGGELVPGDCWTVGPADNVFTVLAVVGRTVWLWSWLGNHVVRHGLSRTTVTMHTRGEFLSRGEPPLPTTQEGHGR